MNEFKKLINKDELKNMVIALFGIFLFAAGINLFIVPVGLYNGGFVGFAQILRTILVDYAHINVGDTDIAGIISFLFNIPLFFLAFFGVSKEFFVKTLICVTFQSVCLTAIKIPLVPIIDDTLSACIIGGIVAGGGTGIALRAGASGGGQDILGVYFTRKLGNFSVGKMGLIINFIVYGICLFMFDISVVIYSVIYTVVLSMTLDKVHVQNICMGVTVFTKTDTVAIRRYIQEELNRGCTYWQGKGGYTDDTTHIIYAVIDKYEYGAFKKRIHEMDEDAFVVSNEDVAVEGRFVKKV